MGKGAGCFFLLLVLGAMLLPLTAAIETIHVFTRGAAFPWFVWLLAFTLCPAAWWYFLARLVPLFRSADATGFGSAAAAALPRRLPISERVRHEVWRRDGGACVDCGSRLRLEYDHIIPVSRGGSNTARNIELRCEACNRRKGSRI